MRRGAYEQPLCRRNDINKFNNLNKSVLTIKEKCGRSQQPAVLGFSTVLMISTVAPTWGILRLRHGPLAANLEALKQPLPSPDVRCAARAWRSRPRRAFRPACGCPSPLACASLIWLGPRLSQDLLEPLRQPHHPAKASP